MTKYQVAPGDTLSGLADRFFGDADLFSVISVANGISDPGLISIGQELFIPYVTYRHRVVSGDTLSALARRFYDSAHLYDVIASANHIDDPDVIDVGALLLIPDLADVGHHMIVPGETLSLLAERWYGEAGLYPIIALANGIAVPDLVVAGRVITRPRLNYRHTCTAGETLETVAEYYYGDPDRASLIGAANYLCAGNPIVSGDVLLLPDLSEF